jgi:D-cysteine desulfhydrase family pyridoxal phosphate-dependent enzyme
VAPFLSIPRVRLASLPTPLHDAVRLRDALGGPERCPRILIKRDDLTGLAMGGNKVRKLEFLIADALRRGATDVITAGAVQSNHCRATVAACVLHDLQTTVVLDTEDPDQSPQGNLLLDRLMGAHVDFVPPGTDKTVRMQQIADEIRGCGRNPYVIPVGGSNAIGTVGYLTMTQELAVQTREIEVLPQWIYFASGSRGTQAGIVLGARVFGLDAQSRGVRISGQTVESDERALRIANEAAAIIGSEVRITPDDIVSIDGYLGPGYAVPTESGDSAIGLLAKAEAIFLDPVYTGKAMGALIDHIRRGVVGSDETVIFVHTGGTPSIFAHAERLAGVHPN